MDREALTKAAEQAKEKAYAPYSHFSVGAALLADNGRIYSGANVEIASFGATICAERAAIAAAVTDGARRILAVAVSGNTPEPLTPCGICRQTLVEFAGPDTPVWCGNGQGEYREHTLGGLLPHAFTPDALDDTE
jgi:cytidine deaminase